MSSFIDPTADRLDALNVKIRRTDVPAEALRLPYARKVFAAATAEAEAAVLTHIFI